MKKHILIWAASIAMLVCAWGISNATLPDDASLAPFPRTATIGEKTEVRNLAATITAVTFADRITDAKGWSASGTWLVVNLEAETTRAYEGGLFSFARLAVGERTFSMTERGTTFYRERLDTGVPRAGSIAFELPADIADDPAAADAVLRIAIPPGVPDKVERDGLIELPLDLTTIASDNDVPLAETDWANR